MRKLMVFLLAGVLWLVVVAPGLADFKVYSTLEEYEDLTGKKIDKFNEAPVLRTKVAAGEIPPVEQRLPEEPLVVEPLEQIGQYGGTYTGASTSPEWGGTDVSWRRYQYLFKLLPDLNTIVPNIAKGWGLSENYRTLTIYLRKGMKWSDGYPFTADDFLFWYEDILLNDELRPYKPKIWTPGGELIKMEKVNDYEIRIEGVSPLTLIVPSLSTYETPFAPKHYLKQYHINHNPNANELAKEEGFDAWWKGFTHHFDYMETRQDLDLPTVYPWQLSKITAGGDKFFDRNPYYWKIDTAGNQLPYIDRQHKMIVGNAEIFNLKAIAGELDRAQFYLTLENYPLYKEGEEKGNYKVTLWDSPWGATPQFVFHQSHKDPVLRKIFRDIRFRQAMSLAINRDEINELFYYGKAVARQTGPDFSSMLYEDWMGGYYAELDLERANELLDEMGLMWDENHEYRLRPDGETLAFTLEFTPVHLPIGKICEQVKRYWKEVGVNVAVKELARGLLVTRGNAGDLDVGTWYFDMATDFALYQHPSYIFYSTWVGNHEWYNWSLSGGERGEEPPANVKKEFELIDQWQQLSFGTEEWIRVGKEIWTLRIENLTAIGTVGGPPGPVIVKNDLGNTLKTGKATNEKILLADQWFFKK